MAIVPTAAQPAAVEIGAGLWAILPGLDEPGPQRAEGLRTAALAALDRGALDVVVEPGGLSRTGAGALDVLGALSDSLLARGGRLWLARAGERDEPLAFVPVGEGGLEPLLEARALDGESGGALGWVVSTHA